MIDYLAQFTGQEMPRGVRFRARYVYASGAYGVVYDQVSFTECIDKALPKRYGSGYVLVVEESVDYEETPLFCLFGSLPYSPEEMRSYDK